MDRETASGTKYVFDSGRELVPQPEGHPLDDLLLGFSRKVLDVLNTDNLVVVSGESGLGKTELFLGKEWNNIHAGGLADLLLQQNRSYQFIDLQSGIAKMEISNLLQAAQKPEIVMIDEAGLLFSSEKVKFDAIQQLLTDGRKVVLVIGGSGNATKKNKDMSEGLKNHGIIITPRQLFEFPAYTLNKFQSEQILRMRFPKLDHDGALEIIEGLDKQNIPKTFRVINKCFSKPEFNTSDSVFNFIYHIKIVPN